jgi:hypothetical protein
MTFFGLVMKFNKQLENGVLLHYVVIAFQKKNERLIVSKLVCWLTPEASTPKFANTVD